MELAPVLAVIAALLVVISLIQPLADILRLSPSVLLAVVGIGIGALSSFLLHTDVTDAFNGPAAALLDLPVGSEVFLYVFLPLLLFHTALTLDVRRMIEDAAPILLLAVVAVIVSTAVIGLALAPVANVPTVACLLLGAIVATTDPVAVVGIFRDLGAPGRLTRLVEGESLLNDAAAITLFTILLGLLVTNQTIDPLHGGLELAKHFLGGVAMGYGAGRVCAAMIPLLRGNRPAEVTLTLALPYLAFIGAERLFGVSGVVAVVASALTMGVLGPPRMAPGTWTFLEELWEQLAFWASSLIFVLASILIPRLLITIDLRDLVLLAILVAAATAARAAVLFGLLPFLSRLKLAQGISNPFKAVILWGGLRGAVTLALALSVTENRAVPAEIQRFVAVLATGFVLVTLLVNGTTLRLLIRLLRLDQLSPVDRALRQQVLALALSNVREAIQDTAREYHIAPPLARAVDKSYEQRIESADGAAIDGIQVRDRLRIGLIALTTRERDLILEHFRQRTVSNRIVERLLADVGLLVERARIGGRSAYAQAMRRLLAFSPRFRAAQFLQRHFRIEGPLVARLGDRFELLLANRIVLEELTGFVARRMPSVLGQEVARLLGEVLAQRLELVTKALAALSLQYPDYAEALEGRFLRKVALRREELEYRTLFEEGLIGAELHGDLRQALEAARRHADERPSLDLGLRQLDLVSQFPMFSALDRGNVEEIAKLLSPRFATPGEKLIRKGERGDEIFFISSGAVEVDAAGRKIRLGRGDFFGELALLGRRRRSSNVVALGYCQLLVLEAGDMERLMARSPDLRAHMDQVAAARTEMNRRFVQEDQEHPPEDGLPDIFD